MEKNASLILANGWKIARRLVNGEQRMELTNRDLSFADREMLKEMGLFQEMINWQARMFLPTDKPAVLERLLASKPLLEVAEPGNRYSRAETVTQMAARQSPTAREAREELRRALGEKALAAMERSGKLAIHAQDPTRTGAAGYVDNKGVIHLIPKNMDGSALSVALHEAMHVAKDERFIEGDRSKLRLAHAALQLVGVKNFVGNPSFTNLVQQAYRMASEGNPIAQAALQKAKLEAPHNIPEEFLAYLVQYAPENMPLVRRIVAAIRAALYRMGVSVKMTPADVRALARSALKAQAKAAGKTQSAARSLSLIHISEPTRPY